MPSPQSMHISIPTGATNDIALSQAVATLGYVNLNGPLNGTRSFIEDDYMRNISITDLSASDLSGITFTISGVQNGVQVGEELNGPTASATVYSVKYYDSISSIRVSSAVTNICVGSGNLSTVLYRVNTSPSRYSSPAYQISLNNLDATVNTRIDSVLTVPIPLSNYLPDTDVNYGAYPIKSLDASAYFNSASLEGFDLPFPVQGIFVTVEDFPVVPVVVNILQG